MVDPTNMTATELAQHASEDVQVIAELVGDETAQVGATIDDLIGKGISQQTQDQISSQASGFEPLQKKIASPPFNPLKLALLLEQNTRLRRSVHLRARNTVGLGWSIKDVKVDDAKTKPSEKDVRDQKERLNRIYGNPQPRTVERAISNALPLDFAEISYRSKVDEEATGNGYFEVTRNNGGAIDGIFNIPAHTIRVLKAGGFVQLRGRRRKFFKSFGDVRAIDADTGEVGNNLTPEKRANEIIQFVVYSSRSSYYGICRWISAVAAVQGSRLSAIRNIAFFENDAVGRMAIVVSGGSLSKEAAKDIRDFVNREAKGVEKAHRVMVLQADPKRIIGGKGKETKIDVVPLTVGVTEDASFLGYRTANDEEIRESFGLAPIFFTGLGVNRSSGGVLRRVTIEQDLVPDLQSHENIWGSTVSYDVLTHHMSDTEKEKFKLLAKMFYDRPSPVDDLEVAQIQGMQSRAGIVTVNEAREAIGLKPLPKEIVYGQVALPMAKAYLDAGLLLQPAIAPDGPMSLEDTQRLLGENDDVDDEDESLSDAETEKIRAKFSYLQDIGQKLSAHLKSKHGRDVVGAELVLESSSGRELGRFPMDDLPHMIEEE